MLTDEWVMISHGGLCRRLVSVVDMVDYHIVVMMLTVWLQDAYDTYAVDPSRPRGRAVIIANSKFSGATTLTERKGTEVDVRRLKSVFEGLSFEVDVYNNLLSQVSNTVLLRIHWTLSMLLYYTLCKSL